MAEEDTEDTEDPGADIDRELDQGDRDDVGAPAARPAAAPDLASWRPAPGAQAFSPIGASAGSLSSWRPAPGAQAFDAPFGEVQPEKKSGGIISEVGRGIARGAAGLAYPLAEGVAYGERQLGEFTGNDWLRQQAAKDTAGLQQHEEGFARDFAPSVGSIGDVNSVGSAGRYVAGKVGEIIPQAAGYMTGVPKMIAIGALQGATQAAKENNGDPAATVVGATIGAAAAGAPAHFLFGQAGQGVVKGAVRGALGMAGVGVAQQYAEPIAGVAAGNPYKAPTAAQLSESLATGLITGAMFGSVGGARSPSAPVTRDVTRNEQLALPAPIADDRAAALKETLALPAPQKQLPAPSTGYGEGFTMPPPGTPAVPLQPAVTGPRARETGLLPAPDLQRGVSGEGFSVQQPAQAAEPAKPSGGMNRGNLIDGLVQAGQNPQQVRRLKIGDLRGAYDRVMAQPEATRQEFRPPVIPESDHPVDQAAAKAAGEPTPAQAEAGNYQKGHVSVQGLDISIETPQGGVRRGPVDEATGKPAWEATMPAHYGYIKGTVGGDGEHVDVTMGPRTKALFDGKPSEAAGEPVFIVDQIDPKTGKFDEHKALIGFHTQEEATRAYDESFSDGSGPSRRGAVTEKTFGDFKDWLQGDTTKAVAYKKPTVGQQLRAVQKQRMAEPVAALVKKNQAKPRVAETKIEEETESVASEVENQPQVYEHETAGPTTVVREPEGEKGRSLQTTNKDRILGDLEKKVTNGELSAAEADKEYGRKESAGGRARKYPDFAAWLRERIAKAEDPKTQEDILARADALQNDKKLVGARRIAASRSINEELTRTDPEYISKLKDALHELERPEPAEEKAAREGRKQSALDRIQAARKKLGGGDDVAGALRSPAERLFADERINQPVHDLFDSGRTATAHEYFDRIANDPVIKLRLPHVVALVRRLKELLPAELRIMPSFEAAKEFNDPERFLNDRMAGGFDPKHDIIFFNPNARETAGLETVTHESVHAATTYYIRRLPEGSRDRQVLNTIAEELLTNKPKDLDKAEESTFQYATNDIEELHAHLMTSPTMQRIAASITPSREFTRRMAQLGYPQNGSHSLWKSFTSWVRKALGLQVLSDSVFDRVMRPLQELTERGAEFSRGHRAIRRGDSGLDHLPAELRQPAEEVADAVRPLPRFGRDDIDEVIRQVRPDAGNLSRTGRRWVLQGATTDGITNWNRALFESRDPEAPGNLLERYRTATEAIAAKSKDFRDQWADKVSGLVDRLRGPDRDKLATLMNDATIAEAHLGTNANNDHLTKPEQQAELGKLQARYNALSPEGKRSYNALRDYYRSTYEDERSAQLQAMIKTAMPEATPAQVEALTTAAKTQRGIKQLIDNPDASPAAAAFADAWQRNRALARGIAKVHSQGFTRGDYFPLRRFGDWVVHYGTKGEDDYGVEMFERYGDAEARRAELVKQGTEPSQVMDKRASHLRDLVPTTVMDELDAAVRHSLGQEHADSVRDLFASIMLQHASRSEAARTRLRRQGIKGASLEAERVLARDFLALSSRMGYLEHGPDRSQALAAMRRHVDYLGRNGAEGEQPRAQAVLHELEQRQPSGDDASSALGGWVRNKMTNMGYIYSLMSPSHMLTSTIEAHMNSSSLLGARHGYARAGLALAKALKDISPNMAVVGARNTLKAVGQGLKAADWNLSYAVRDRLIAQGANRGAMTDLFNRLNNAGLIDHSMVREIQRIANPGKDISKGWWGRFMDMNAAGAHAVDVANKSAIAKAAYDLELRRGGSHDLAAKYAVEMARQSMPNYNLANKARISTNQGILGGAAAPLTQFKQYGIHMYSMMSNLLRASIHGASRQERMEARKAFAGILATHALIAGSLTLIADPLRYVGGAYDWITGADRPHDYQNDVRSWIASAFGPELGEIISRGLPHAAGFDIHRRVGLANLLEVPELKSFDAKGYMETLAAAMTGAAGEDATQIAAAMGKMIQGDIMGGLKGMVPRVVRDPMKAMALADKGVTDSKGKTILPASKLSAGDIAYQALGFQPSKVSEFREGRNAILEAREEQTHARSKVMTAFSTAAPADRKDVIEQVRSYNREHPHEPITYSQLLQAAKRQQEQVKQPGSFGLHLPKKGAKDMSQHGSFANAP